MIPGTFEELLCMSKKQFEKLGKPFAAVNKYGHSFISISQDHQNIIKDVYNIS